MKHLDQARSKWNAFMHPSMSDTPDKRTPRQLWRDRAIATCAVAGAVFAIWSTTFGRASTPEPPLVGNSSIAASTLAQSFGTEFVSTYLGASKADQKMLQNYITYPKLELPAVRSSVTDARPLLARELTRAADGVSIWNVVVSVADPTATAVVKNATTATARAYYAVPIAVIGSAPRAMTLPRRVEAPPVGVDVALGYEYKVNDGPLGDVVSAFIRAYLTDPKQVARYVHTDATITAPSPTPYTSLSNITMIADRAETQPADGDVIRVLVTVTASTLSYTATALSYPLELAVAGGHWQVRAIEPIPALGDGVEESQPQPSATSTSPSPSAPPATRSSSSN